ncbi:uncharacterized protein TRIADDRAFT_51427 [Trichoplax adhaerens]|uniref:Uncharacterized protein n=1 Tax=Trichoplax adhaerens TaxID=10228 RepID=B3RJ66_TRIAD|nr:predicted protein [Trichoplax adhaerens]EDV29277.1 predicted protein [Trichoplax adhaerens]|eukprot:XP_002108479.1 predicted protein [Trichoplax adhaerens]
MTHKPAGKPVSEWKMDQLDVIISPKNKTVAVNSNQSVDLYVKPQTLILAMTGFSHQTFVCHQGYDFQFQPQDGSIRINNIKLQPFDVTNGQFSYKVFYCPSKDKHQDRRFHQSIAPLIVGGVLAIITVIVLIVYVIVLLVARYRDKDHYQTVTDLQH